MGAAAGNRGASAIKQSIGDEQNQPCGLSIAAFARYKSMIEADLLRIEKRAVRAEHKLKRAEAAIEKLRIERTAYSKELNRTVERKDRIIKLHKKALDTKEENLEKLKAEYKKLFKIVQIGISPKRYHEIKSDLS